MPTVINQVGDALFLITVKGRAERLWFGFWMGMMLLIVGGFWGALLSSTWRFEFRVARQPDGGSTVTYRTWAGTGFLPLEKREMRAARKVRSVQDGPGQRRLIVVDTANGPHEIELASRWRHHSYDYAYYADQLLSKNLDGAHGDQMDVGAGYGISAVTGCFGLAALLFAGMGFRVDRLMADRRHHILTCQHELFKLKWTRTASWRDITNVSFNHHRLNRRAQPDFYFLQIEFSRRRKWIFEIDAGSVGGAEAYATQLRHYLKT